ncbi:guided entry of tail-anchored proteins factor 1-like [Diorhabda carinulata]|uniref:guided entry of tail-anchored proteins factor 1-like n=1 Tax=Diorhabda carinulata TaxID=1163345 RepID=UPI0025A2780C|nr:guided entry of tail-anchored proteins factor 1-like [Diorhabda carinulata]
MGITLLLVATALSFINVHSNLISKQLLKWLNRPSFKEKQLLSKKNDLKTQQSTISITENFVIYSKIQRQINKIDDELGECRVGKNSLTTHFGLTFGIKFLFSVILLMLSVYFRSTPIIILDKNIDLMPFNYLISYPNSGNAVSFHFWVMCSSAVANLIEL